MTKESLSQYVTTIESNVCGIPCIVGVTEFNKVKGKSNADNPDDYYGYTTCEFDILDRKGYYAKWLSNKMTDKIKERIQSEIEQYFNDEKYCVD